MVLTSDIKYTNYYKINILDVLSGLYTAFLKGGQYDTIAYLFYDVTPSTSQYLLKNETMSSAILTQCHYSSVCTGEASEDQAWGSGWGFPVWGLETSLETLGFSFSLLGTHLEITK